MRLSILAAFVMLVLAASAHAAAGDTTVAPWKDNRTATFLLMFDDSWPSHFQMAVPALKARQMTATFYINPGKGEYKACKKEWEEKVWKEGMVYGNHTMTHNGITSPEDAEMEVGDCTREILRLVPGKANRLISWATPGVGKGKWTITPAELEALWRKYNLIDRPPFAGHGVVYHLKEPEEMLAMADAAIAKGGMEYLVFHGVERRDPYNWSYQDFWAYNFDKFLAVLDGLKERRDAGKLWITDHISYHQYKLERESAAVRTLSADGSEIVLELKCGADPQLYDHPLTLITEVPADWKTVTVRQDETSTQVAASEGRVMFDAKPNAGSIRITRQ